MSENARSRGEIFVVDDDPAIREILSMVLSAGGYQVICFADGAALLAVARTRCPACILLDVHIPGKSGLDILKELHGEDYPARSTSSKNLSGAAKSFTGSMRRSRHMHVGKRRIPRRMSHRCIFPDANL